MKQFSLKEARAKRRLTQEELEAASGVDQSVISRIERGLVTNPEFDTVRKLAKALGIESGQLRIGEQRASA